MGACWYGAGPPPPRRNRFAISSGCGEGYRVGVLSRCPCNIEYLRPRKRGDPQPLPLPTRGRGASASRRLSLTDIARMGERNRGGGLGALHPLKRSPCHAGAIEVSANRLRQPKANRASIAPPVEITG